MLVCVGEKNSVQLKVFFSFSGIERSFKKLEVMERQTHEKDRRTTQKSNISMYIVVQY